MILCHPVRLLVVVCRSEDRRLVCPELRGFLQEPGDEECCHTGIALQPQLDVCDWGFGGARRGGWTASAARVSSPQISALSLDISMNFRSSIFFAVFGSTLARGYTGQEMTTVPTSAIPEPWSCSREMWIPRPWWWPRMPPLSTKDLDV